MDPAVHILRIHGVVGFDSLTTLPSKNIQVDYTIGDHGPFVLITPEKEFSEAYVDAETTKRANQLRALGALPK